MKLYLAAAYTSNLHHQSNQFLAMSEFEQEQIKNAPNILESYHYIWRDRHVRVIRRDGTRVFLDSGAFSAFTKGAEVDLPAYCDYILANEDIIRHASVLDGIGDPLKTWQNQQEMESRGTRPLPCFHYGEPVEYLQHYIDNYEYITIGGMVPITTPQLKYWLDEIWDKYLTDANGVPKLKVHGFGLTAIPLMERYPWYSVDSSAWIQGGSNGSILMPKFGALSISHNSPNRKKLNQHLDTLPEPQKRAIIEYIESKGFDVERLRETYLARWAWNCWAYNEIARRITEERTAFKRIQPTLF
ncbi:MAG: hypothetical protein AB7C95_00680 [Synergistaceae bacterium]